VERLPADWFPRETHGLLAQYCRHVTTARRLARLVEQLEAAEDLNLRDYNRLLVAQERETRCIASLATRMRISQQARYDKSRRSPMNPPSNHGSLGRRTPSRTGADRNPGAGSTTSQGQQLGPNAITYSTRCRPLGDDDRPSTVTLADAQEQSQRKKSRTTLGTAFQ
jgi:hypothetical protein